MFSSINDAIAIFLWKIETTANDEERISETFVKGNKEEGIRFRTNTRNKLIKHRSNHFCCEHITGFYMVQKSRNKPRNYLVNINTYVSQIRYLLVVILELNSVSEVQYKDMMIDR